MPRPRFPTLIESDYATALVELVTRSRDALAPLLEALPWLLGAAGAARGVRIDEDESQLTSRMIERASRMAEAASDRTIVEGLASKAGQQVSAHQRGELDRQSRAALGVSVPTVDQGIGPLIRHFTTENAALIKSLAGRPVDDVAKIVTRAFTTNAHPDTVAAEIQARYGIAERHARLIARDQIAKLNGQITAARHQELGLKRYRWRTMRDRRVRPTHRDREGKIFEYGKGPIPGTEICCRCVEEPMFDDILALLGGPAPAPLVSVPKSLAVPTKPLRKRNRIGGAAPVAPVAAPPVLLPRPVAVPVPAAVAPGQLAAAGGGDPPSRKPRQPRAPVNPSAPPRPLKKKLLPDDERLRNDIVATRKRLTGAESGANASEQVSFQDGTKAIWKTAEGETRLRSNVEPGTYYKREIAAKQVARLMGVDDLVPSTVERTLDGKVGSLQRWVDNGKRLMARDRGIFSQEDSERVRVFDFVIGNSDRHVGNILKQGRGGSMRPVLIDHGLSFPNGRPLRFIQPTVAFHQTPGQLLERTRKQIADLDLEKLGTILKQNGIDDVAIEHTLLRARYLQLNPQALAVPEGRFGEQVWEHAAQTAHVSLPPAEDDAVFDIVKRVTGR